MKIKQINSQSRRDYECEHCEFIERDAHGYDDANFHPMSCKQCGKTAPYSYRPLTTKYPEEFTI